MNLSQEIGGGENNKELNQNINESPTHNNNKNNSEKKEETGVSQNDAQSSPEQSKREPSAQEIEEAVSFASSATGVRKDFIMGMLVVESDLGRNPGQCTYEEVEKGAEQAHLNGQLSYRAWNTFLERRNVFKKIASGLGYDYKGLKVSCNPSRYAGTGGAMGVPQFMPDTWLDYKDKVARITGKKNPDPWNLKDGAVAMAVKLADVPGVVNHNYWSERNAAKMYLSGTTSWQYDWYANQILYWADNYRQVLS